MIYENHKLFENIKNIKGTKDMRISRELIISELSKIILSRPHEVKNALQDCGVAVTDRPSKVELVKKVSFNVARSRCLRYNLGVLIMNNQMPFDDGYSNKSGGNDWGGVIGDVIGTSFGIWQTSQQRKEGAAQRAHEMSLAQKNSEIMLKQMELQSQLSTPGPTQAGVGGSSTTVMLLLGIGVIGIIGFVIWSSRKNKAGGGTAPVVVAAPQPTAQIAG